VLPALVTALQDHIAESRQQVHTYNPSSIEIKRIYFTILLSC